MVCLGPFFDFEMKSAPILIVSLALLLISLTRNIVLASA
ncbi:hypothetical protein Pr1d_11730 [Bythopirellula goksoeyrii]|uniref:Uncharacterized protein n=1 Tax=Bythopirellula goksoeyrii TaxID=1400387 RepID=A0A5B9QIE1_9BACT|nr:hypothetical protein Pr1d_11730 [Bythopirellula goksoeyrii]